MLVEMRVTFTGSVNMRIVEIQFFIVILMRFLILLQKFFSELFFIFMISYNLNEFV